MNNLYDDQIKGKFIQHTSFHDLFKSKLFYSILENGHHNFDTITIPIPELSRSISTSSFGHQSIIINGTRFRIGLCGLIALTVTILLLTLLIIIFLAITVLVYSPIPLIKFDLVGNLTGEMCHGLQTSSVVTDIC
jgi:hypothetical protein